MPTTPEERAFERLVSKFPKRFRVKGTQYLRGVLKGLAEGDAYIETQVEAVRDNLIAVTASGRHLDRRAGLYGVTRGRGAGIFDEDFRDIIPLLGMSPKQISHILLKIIDIIYGPYSSHANVTASAPETYNLEDLYDLRVRVDHEELTITFEDEDFININAATAQEVATAISNKTTGRLIGSVLTDAQTGEKFINIRTSTIGSQGFVQVLGGEAQRVLQFPEIRPVAQDIVEWDVSRYEGTDEMVYTFSLPPSAIIDLPTNDTNNDILDANNERMAQTIVNSTGGDKKLASVNSRWRRIGNPTGNLYMELWTSAGSSPATLQGTSDPIDMSTIPNASSDVLFSFPTAPDLLDGQEYWLVARGVFTFVDGLNRMQISKQSGNVYPDGASYTASNPAGPWSIQPVLDWSNLIVNTSAVLPDLKEAGVVSGDLVTIREDSGFNLKNTGTFEVSFVGENFFRLINPEGVVESGVTQLHVDDFTFYRPDLGNVLLSQRPAAITEISSKELTVLLPVSSPLTKRTLRGGSHFHGAVTRVTATTSNTIDLDSAVGFADPAGVVRPLLDRKLSNGVISSIVGSTVNLLNGQNWPEAGAFYSNTQKQFFFYEGLSGNALQNVTPAPPTSIVGDTVHYVEHYLYTGISGSQLTGVFPDPTILGLEGKEVATAGAEVVEGYPGSYLFDPNAPFTAAEEASRLSEDIFQGDVKTVLLVDDIADWPESGSFVLEFNTEESEGPIKYLAKIDDSAMIIDPSHIFKREHLTGTGIRLIRQAGPIVPRVDGSDLMVYSTSTSPARDILAEYLRLIAASGILFRFIIKVPEQKWEVIPNLYSTDPLASELVTI